MGEDATADDDPSKENIEFGVTVLGSTDVLELVAILVLIATIDELLVFEITADNDPKEAEENASELSPPV